MGPGRNPLTRWQYHGHGDVCYRELCYEVRLSGQRYAHVWWVVVVSKSILVVSLKPKPRRINTKEQKGKKKDERR